jgi:hypothetical protein
MKKFRLFTSLKQGKFSWNFNIFVAKKVFFVLCHFIMNISTLPHSTIALWQVSLAEKWNLLNWLLLLFRCCWLLYSFVIKAKWKTGEIFMRDMCSGRWKFMTFFWGLDMNLLCFKVGKVLLRFSSHLLRPPLSVCD